MMGKLILPLAIGGGLLLMLSSSSQASPAQASFDALPTPLKQLVIQAHATQDPAMFEYVATQLDAQGYPGQASLLRAQGRDLRARQTAAAAPTQASTTAPARDFESLPAAQKQLVIQAHATQDPRMFEYAASQLDAQGFPAEAALLRAQSSELRAAQASATSSASPSQSFTAQPNQIVVSPPAAPTAPSSPPPFFPSPADQAPAQAAMPADLQSMIDQAIQNGTVPVLTSTAFVVEKAGFPAAAEELRQRARDIAARVPAPPPQDRPNVALDPNMPADLSLEVARQLQLQGDPNALEALAAQMRQRGFNNTADQLEAKAKQIRVMLDAARTMNNIDAEMKTPGVQPTQASLPTAPPPAAIPPPTQTIPITVTATPSAPIPVPSVAQPQPPPSEKSKGQILAETLATSLNELIERYGSVPKARYKEDTGMVKRFQAEEQLPSDGLYGPTSAEHVAHYASDVPPPFHWKKGATQKDLSRYRSNIESIALDAEQLGNTDRAQRLRASAQRASLA